MPPATDARQSSDTGPRWEGKKAWGRGGWAAPMAADGMPGRNAASAASAASSAAASTASLASTAYLTSAASFVAAAAAIASASAITAAFSR